MWEGAFAHSKGYDFLTTRQEVKDQCQGERSFPSGRARGGVL